MNSQSSQLRRCAKSQLFLECAFILHSDFGFINRLIHTVRRCKLASLEQAVTCAALDGFRRQFAITQTRGINSCICHFKRLPFRGTGRRALDSERLIHWGGCILQDPGRRCLRHNAPRVNSCVGAGELRLYVVQTGYFVVAEVVLTTHSASPRRAATNRSCLLALTGRLKTGRLSSGLQTAEDATAHFECRD